MLNGYISKLRSLLVKNGEVDFGSVMIWLLMPSIPAISLVFYLLGFQDKNDFIGEAIFAFPLLSWSGFVILSIYSLFIFYAVNKATEE